MNSNARPFCGKVYANQKELLQRFAGAAFLIRIRQLAKRADVDLNVRQIGYRETKA